MVWFETSSVLFSVSTVPAMIQTNLLFNSSRSVKWVNLTAVQQDFNKYLRPTTGQLDLGFQIPDQLVQDRTKDSNYYQRECGNEANHMLPWEQLLQLR